VPLDEVGHEQAASAGRAVAAAGPSAVWSSDLVRAVATAQAIGLPVHTDKRLREIDLGSDEGGTPAQWRERDPAGYRAWRAGADVRRGGGETYAEVALRAQAALGDAQAELADRDGLLVVVTHGGTIRALLTALLALPSAPWARLGGLNNCCCALLADGADERGWRLSAYGVPPQFLLP
jgi:broad specificity phosphatase PhoE